MSARSLQLTVFMGLAALASPAFAQSGAPTPATSPFANAPLDDAALSRVSGRDGTPTWVSSHSSSNADVGGNSVGDGSPTGTLSVSDNAFQNVTGISMVNLNTGNNSAINASMNINVVISPMPAAGGSGGM